MNSFPPGNPKELELAERMSALGVQESDIKETFVRSGGHGGQNVNKTSTTRPKSRLAESRISINGFANSSSPAPPNGFPHRHPRQRLHRQRVPPRRLSQSRLQSRRHRLAHTRERRKNGRETQHQEGSCWLRTIAR